MAQPDPQFEALLLYLKEARGFDFTGYKRSSLMRRVDRRMTQAAVPTYGDYLDHLQVDPDEFTALFDTILINVTAFFRDLDSWDFVRTEAVPKLIASRDPNAPIRVWSAGCASGEEAYTLAMVLAEVLGPERFRQRVKIYATDVDEEGLAQARQAAYSRRSVAGMPQELVDRYFEQVGDRFLFRKDLRRAVIFGRNDLIQDAPISRIDLLVCRNTLMYFNAETQSRILARFHFALADPGVLFLGKAEMLLSHSDLFLPVDLKRRVFRKVSRILVPNGHTFPGAVALPVAPDLSALDRLRGEAFIASPVAQVVVTADGIVALSNRQAEVLFGVSTKDIGRPFRDLELSYRPVELRGYIERAQVERRPARLGDIEHFQGPNDVINLEVQVNPLVDSDAHLLGVVLIFQDVTAARRLHDELELANQQLEAAYEELQSTNEELETTNEELQSTVEELETTNEELQSTNEELETMNEELQSTNDELQCINEELRVRTGELDQLNAFLEAVFASLRAGVVVVDAALQIQVWNERSQELWGLRPEEAVGQHFLNLDIGLPIEGLRPMIRQALTAEVQPQELTLPAVNRRGRQIEIRVVCTPLRRNGAGATGVILLMDYEESVN